MVSRLPKQQTVVIAILRGHDYSLVQTGLLHIVLHFVKYLVVLVIHWYIALDILRIYINVVYLQVTKNRFDGTLGKVYLDFNRDSLTMSSYQGTNAASAKKENKIIRSSKPPKPSPSSKRTKIEGDERVTSSGTKAGNREKESSKYKNMSIDSPSIVVVSDDTTKVLNPIKTSSPTMKLTKSEAQIYKIDKNTSTDDPRVSSNNSVGASNYVSFKTTSSFEPSRQAVTLKKDENSKGTALKTKATSFNRQSDKRSMITGKKISVKQLDVNKVYLQ